MNETLEDLLAALERAREMLVVAQIRERQGRHDACEALNVYNEATKKVDAYMKDLRSTAPHGADWGKTR